MTGARTKDGILGNEAGVKHLERLQEQIIDLGDDVPYETLVRVRRVLDREVAESGGFFGKSLKDTSKLSAKQEAANSIRRELGKTRPDIARINAEFSLWKTTGEILEETARRTQGPVYATRSATSSSCWRGWRIGSRWSHSRHRGGNRRERLVELYCSKASRLSYSLHAGKR